MAAAPMVAGPVWAGIDHTVVCKIYNSSTKPYDVTIDLVGVESNTVLETSGVTSLASGGYAMVFAQGVSAQVLCRFTGTTPKKSSATLSLYHLISGDGTDTVSIPAH